MIFNTHSRLAGQHAFLAPSNPAWLRYDDDKLDRVFLTARAAKRGNDLHALAAEMIRLGIKPLRTRQTFNQYVTDALGYRMTAEQVLYYSDNCFGTADSIGFRENLLRIHDLKTGVSHASFDQLLIYAALFCLEYRIRPFDIRTVLRIYQNDTYEEIEGDPDDITRIMSDIRHKDERINAMKMEELG